MGYPVTMRNSTGPSPILDRCSCPPRDGSTISLRMNPVIVEAVPRTITCTGCGHNREIPVTWRYQIRSGLIAVRAPR